MDVDGLPSGGDEAIATSSFSVNVLQLIKTAQAQHGGRYGDYQRYRRYCTARLRRLYKSSKFLHGRNKYTPKTLDAATVTDVRHLHIALHLAERAWSYAMELKQVEGGPDFARKRAHLLRRLTKAAKWGDLFADLCAQRADPRTALEAEAYASYLWGTVLLERETEWETALSKFLRARAVYEQLGKVGDVEHQVRCRERVDELEPNIRYCHYKLGTANPPDTSSLLQLGEASGVLSSKLEAVMTEARAQQAASMTELEWLGRKLPVHNSKTRLCIVKAQELEAELAKGDAAADRQLSLYDKVFVAYQDAKRQIGDDQKAAGDAADVRAGLEALDRAVTSLLLQRTLERNQVLVAVACARLERQQAAGGAAREEAREKPAKPEDLVRLHDTLIQNVLELMEKASPQAERWPEVEAYEEELAAKQSMFEATRCYYVAQAYAAASKLAEAYVLYARAAQKAQGALHAYQQLGPGGAHSSAEEEAVGLSARCRAQRCLIHARANLVSVRAAEGLPQSVARLSVKEPPAAAPSGQAEAISYLIDFLDDYRSAVGPAGSKQPPRIAPTPPPFRAVACRPIVLDTALNAVAFPSLAGRAKKEAKKSAGIFNFWRR